MYYDALKIQFMAKKIPLNIVFNIKTWRNCGLLFRIVRNRHFFKKWNPQSTKKCAPPSGFYNFSRGESDFGDTPSLSQKHSPFLETPVFCITSRGKVSLVTPIASQNLSPSKVTPLTFSNVSWGEGASLRLITEIMFVNPNPFQCLMGGRKALGLWN